MNIKTYLTNRTKHYKMSFDSDIARGIYNAKRSNRFHSTFLICL